MTDCFVGSTNPVKMHAAEIALSDMLEMPVLTEGLVVDSGVPDQPLSAEETRQGAINRVEACLAEVGEDYPDAWYIGIEGGVDVLEDGPATFAYVAICHRLRWSVSRSASLPLPPSVFQALQSGRELGAEMDRLFNTDNVKQKGGAIGLLTHNRATRQSVYELAITLALAPFNFPDLY
ncbi:inosine/xanthosine triphosphatase [Alteromonas sp. ASW11-19]|uniref:Inosine/xanthosine triphosphatase n=1 Tax=Alteromonas salexigens TaxID=2982530 RepID=A0ABT2VM32_9ALTE|nr:inosine/xanthosine triphosphatase [Alteromonas salexigens]MCU7553513.1 inosine/xanthosine triphosphatase [Alteromonas salexigens]